MSASSIAASFADLNTADRKPPTAVGQTAAPSSANPRKPKRSARRLVVLCAAGALWSWGFSKGEGFSGVQWGGARGAAIRLGMKRTTLLSRMKKYGLRRPDDPVSKS